MGIPSLNSAILYNVSLNFHSNHANIPDLGQENGPISGQQAYFWHLGLEKCHFYGQKQKTTAEAVVRSLAECYSFHHSLR